VSAFITILLLAAIGVPLFVIVGMVTGVSFMAYTDVVNDFYGLKELIKPFEDLLGRIPFLAIPLFIASGAVMTSGGLAQRLVGIFRAAFGWVPGGMAVAAIMSCVMFAAISGSSPVTLIAVGSIMFPAMVEARYPENFSLGVIMTAGSLGCLVPPALSILIYTIAVAGRSARVDPGDMFLAAAVPAGIIALFLVLYSVWVGRRIPGPRPTFSWAELWYSIKDGVWALLLPVIVLGGIYTGFYSPYQAGSIALVYSLVVTMFIYRELDLKKVILVLADAGKLMGMLILIIVLAFGLNAFLAEIRVEQKLLHLLESWNLGPVGFMLLVNVVLILLGALMDSVSATLIFAPILAPIAVSHYGMDPLHFGVVFIVNMEIGYLAPPVATNLFVAAAVFKKPFGQVCRAVMPTLGVTCAALVLFMYVPTCSTGLVSVKKGEKVWKSFPWGGLSAEERQGVGRESIEKATDKAADEAKKGPDQNTMSEEDYYAPKAPKKGKKSKPEDGASKPKGAGSKPSQVDKPKPAPTPKGSDDDPDDPPL